MKSAHIGWIEAPPRNPDRYEPLPGMAELPAWLWRRAGRGVRIGVGFLLLAAIGLAVAFGPELRESLRERDARTARERAEHRAQLARELELAQRPRSGRSDSVAPAGATRAERLAARAVLVDDVAAAVSRDARARTRSGELEGTIRRVACEPFPRVLDGTGAEADLSKRRGRYSCLAITADFTGGAIGHPYRALVNFETGRYTFCKISGQPEPSREQLATTPRACGG